jgi:hypothetical protein
LQKGPISAATRKRNAFFLANGGPASNPHKLGHDNDGLACESN